MGERSRDALKVTFDPTLKLEFHEYFRFWGGFGKKVRKKKEKKDFRCL